MGCQDEMVEMVEMVKMESQGNKGRGETPVHRDHLAHKVRMHFDLYSSHGTSLHFS